MYVEIFLIFVASLTSLFIGVVAWLGKRAITKLDKLGDNSNQTNEILARMDERDQHQADSISVLRKRTHDHANALQHHETRISILEINKQ